MKKLLRQHEWRQLMPCLIAASANQPNRSRISQTVAKVDPSLLSDEELAPIVAKGATTNTQAH
jgi:hypothetical protein